QARGNSGSRDDRLTFSCQCHLGEQLREPLWQRLADNLTQRTQRHFHESYQHHWQGVRRSQPLAAYWREAYQSFTNLYQLLHVQLGDEAMARLLGITESEAPNGNDSDTNGH
ncbi:MULTISPECIES: hypothetical protein, partial [unclassified Aeromonas]|uniref:hypothetical protein n=1 Tax=unclassified Aeromonas TaxID=257493 RepID=UPI0022E6779D